MTRDEWLAAFAATAGAPVPSADDIDALLELAGIAAHASERTAAPITCWIAATAGLTLVSGALYARVGAHGFWVMAALCVLAFPLTWPLRQPADSASGAP